MKVASRVKRGSLESTVQGLFISAPYPGDQKFFGQPTGLLYALSVLADRKLQKTSSKEIVSVEMPVWAPAGVTDFSNSKLKEELTDYITEHRPKVVGISTFSASYQNALAIKDLVKKIAPETLVVFGGAHEDNFVKHYRKNDRIDADLVVAGDGSHLLDAVYSIVESNPHATVEEIKQNIYSRREELESLP
ncbi:cobalamin B12-binding domain-containing protein, partial [archaeon]|nr:cobalamin B12-binding domain-containing protein [archaeon]